MKHHEDDPWYTALSRLTGYTAWEHWAAHYPGQSGMDPARCRVIGERAAALEIDMGTILEEMEKEPRVLFACAWRRPDGALCYFDGPNPSIQYLRNATPPIHTPCAGCPAYIVRLEGGAATPVARWSEKNQKWERKRRPNE